MTCKKVSVDNIAYILLLSNGLSKAESEALSTLTMSGWMKKDGVLPMDIGCSKNKGTYISARDRS